MIALTEIQTESVIGESTTKTTTEDKMETLAKKRQSVARKSVVVVSRGFRSNGRPGSRVHIRKSRIYAIEESGKKKSCRQKERQYSRRQKM